MEELKDGKYLDCKGVAKKIIEDNFGNAKDGKDKLKIDILIFQLHIHRFFVAIFLLPP